MSRPGWIWWPDLVAQGALRLPVIAGTAEWVQTHPRGSQNSRLVPSQTSGVPAARREERRGDGALIAIIPVYSFWGGANRSQWPPCGEDALAIWKPAFRHVWLGWCLPRAACLEIALAWSSKTQSSNLSMLRIVIVVVVVHVKTHVMGTLSEAMRSDGASMRCAFGRGGGSFRQLAAFFLAAAATTNRGIYGTAFPWSSIETRSHACHDVWNCLA